MLLLLADFADGKCEAFIAEERWLQPGGPIGLRCDLELVGSPVLFDGAGWAVNFESPCVSRAVEYAIGLLHTQGEIKRTYNRWFPHRKSCPDIVGPDIASDHLEAEQMSGLFVVYGTTMVVLVAIRLVWRQYRGLGEQEEGEVSRVSDHLYVCSPCVFLSSVCHLPH